nr:hypothetical protein [Tanacetum cinerariifolium]
MPLTFAKTHNMVAYLTKSDASEGSNQIIDFLNGSSIKYALTVNPNIYVLCIKQFWTTVAIKKVNDVIRVGKVFFGVDTPLFEGILVEHQVVEEGDADENDKKAGDAAKGDVSAAHGEVPTVSEEPSIRSHTPPTPTPQPSHDIPSTS